MLEPHLDVGHKFYDLRAAQVLNILACNRWDHDDTDAAIPLMERATSLATQHSALLAGDLIRTLAEWQEELKNEEAALVHNNKYADIVDQFANFALGDETVDLVDIMSEDEEEPLPACSSEESAEAVPEAGAQSAWQAYVRGEIDPDSSMETPLKWRNEVAFTDQEALTLPVIDSDRDSDGYMGM